MGTVAALGEGARLLHVGLPKTGTTAIQHALADARPALRAAGVVYPGDAVNHINAASALMGRAAGWDQDVPDLSHWRDAVAEMDALPGGRGVISYEQISEADDSRAARFADELGDAIHVLITLRPYASMVPSAWQQFVKNGLETSLEEWLDAALSGDRERAATPLFFQCYDAGEQVERWVRTVGRDRVTVVMAETSKPRQLFDAVADLLGVPGDLLQAQRLDGYAANRGLSVDEAAFVREVNTAIAPARLSHREYGRLVAHGVIAALLRDREPGDAEGRVAVPEDQVPGVVASATRAVERIRATGVAVVGDLDAHARAPRASAPPAPVTEVALDIAYRAVRGAVSRSLGAGLALEDRPRDRSARVRSALAEADRALVWDELRSRLPWSVS